MGQASHSATLANIRAIVDWQQAGFVHPLTCGNDSTHPDLLPSVGPAGSLVLVCTQCGYLQHFIPEQCLTAPQDSGWAKMKEIMATMGKKV